jgi:predicted ArsR family transcriptional regulator
MRKRPLDKTDIAIIARLQHDGRRAFTSIAKDLGISEASVRQRVSRLLRTNVIQIAPSPASSTRSSCCTCASSRTTMSGRPARSSEGSGRRRLFPTAAL